LVTSAAEDVAANLGLALSRRRFLQHLGFAGAAAVCGEVAAACQPGFFGASGSGDLRLAYLTGADEASSPRAATSLNCLNLAVQEVNAAGGIAGRQVSVVRVTAGGDTGAPATKVTQLMSSEPVDVVIGSVGDQQRRALASALPKLNLLAFDPSPRDDLGCSRYVVSTGQVPSQQVEPLAHWVVQNAGRRIYAVYSDDSWSRAAVGSLRTGLGKTNAQLAAHAVTGTQDMRSLVQNIRQANPDVVWCLLPQPDAERFAQALGEMDVHSLAVMSAWDELSAVAHPSLVAGAITSQPWFMSLSSTESKAFLRAYQARYGAGKPVNSEGEAVYAAVHLYKAAVEKARTTSASAVATALSEVEIRAPRGPLRVDSATRVSTAPCIVGINSGKGTIETHGDLGTSAPRLSGCQNPAR